MTLLRCRSRVVQLCYKVAYIYLTEVTKDCLLKYGERAPYHLKIAKSRPAAMGRHYTDSKCLLRLCRCPKTGARKSRAGQGKGRARARPSSRGRAESDL